MLFLTGFVETALIVEGRQDALAYMENSKLSLGEHDYVQEYKNDFTTDDVYEPIFCHIVVDEPEDGPFEVAEDFDVLNDTVEATAQFIAKLEAGEKGEDFEYKYNYGQIGYGFTKHVYPGLNWKSRITKEEADVYLRKLIRERYIPFLSQTVNVPLSKNQVVALVSLVYNIGEPAFERSSLRYFLNKGDFKKAAAEFGVWRKSSVGSLYKRRMAEKNVFLAQN
jgi:lysozyme